ncbi:MAG: hypothetical protein A3C04_02395 [Candidatus Wildermuthbacteria bacterium RIFCSPHIGHO2_02_FULL_45_25]|uniref:t-SNARE coiled-coil homology domain-containing protein n=1 Tax=Candidatus Wildermuthbacteria bacterium RIFCSPHIGHO2_02_FULL_45_25 TaxID=1802450 RepID=A0A1G2R0E9_9BACT|nr:MAG: hypothetical protein A3C04_02395 [Candidatus Wildermuthbacteria bacterium RIFCSPHIGHO2_02_FULL_45_25]
MQNNHGEVTNEGLARMIAEGFHGVDEKFMQMREEMDTRFNIVDECFDGIDGRLDRIEGILIGDHQRRIEKLEDKVDELRDALAMK